jgi:predicted dehydrogenase/nucleoside-diphosphate-sugar epimerase
LTGNGSRLRVGLIGFGKMGRHHLKAIADSSRATVVGVADPAASAEELKSVLPAEAIVVSSAEELFNRARPDVIHIVTPPSTHSDLAIRAIEAGCHVYVEKPFTPTATEAIRIFTRAAERGVKVCAGHQVLFEAPALAVWEHWHAIGRLVHIESYFSFKMVRRTITAVDQVKDILPHAVYPIVDQMRRATGLADAPIEMLGLSLDEDGEAYALLRLGNLIGTNGSLRADYISGFLGSLVGQGAGPGVLLTPYRRALHTITGTTRGVTTLVFGGSYPGLRMLIARFYQSIQDDTPAPLTPRSIVDTVTICERIGAELDVVEGIRESQSERALRAAEALLPPPRRDAPLVLLTGGTGLLGKRIAETVRQAGFPVRVAARRVPSFSRRVPGVEYVACDLARGANHEMVRGVGYVVHAAAETSGGIEDHRRNSIEATRGLIESAARAGARGFLHISSLAVLKTSREMGRALDEHTPVDDGNAHRGPYVWGKAKSELLAVRLGAELGLPVRIIRPGPLVDYAAFQPPGRLGRELGPLFVAMGSPRSPLSVCDVTTAAKVVRSYLEDFEAAPPLLNMVEAPPPTRRELMDRYRRERPDLRVVWFPGWLLRMLSAPLKLAQRIALGSKEPVDVAAAFASERYTTALAAQVIARADSVAAATASAASIAAEATENCALAAGAQP